jgi:hypothetical protein
VIKTVHQVLASLRKRGLMKTIVFIGHVLRDKYRKFASFDLFHGTDTAGNATVEELDIAGENRNHASPYQATPSTLFKKIADALPIRYEDYIFIDFGSGKGRALLLASNYPFKRIIGIEFSQELHRTAVCNVSKYRSRRQRCFRIEPIYMDAVNYKLPLEPSIIYIFHPFDAEILRAVLTNIKESILHHPRDVRFIYYNPVHADVFNEFGFKNRTIFIEYDWDQVFGY